MDHCRVPVSSVLACLLVAAGCGPGFVPRDVDAGDTIGDSGDAVDSTTDLPEGDGGGDPPDEDAAPVCGDGVVNGDEECDDAAPGECTTGCSTTGSEECVSCVVLSCLPPMEACNDADDDCDGSSDEDLTGCRCTTEDPWDHEECNDIDDDCDGSSDEDLTGCRCTTEDPWDHEECNDIDDDCDGAVDEGLTDCQCTTGDPLTGELCNDVDDDCDGSVDEGLDRCLCTTADPLDHEDCNSTDDDCDGSIDEGLTDCGCIDGALPGAELCNRIDDDCDGSTDEQNTYVTPVGSCFDLGHDCSPARRECSSGLCEGDDFEHYCTEECDPLSPDPPCAAPDWRCWTNTDTAEVDFCRRNYDPCTHEAVCVLGEACAVVEGDDGVTLVTECRPEMSTSVVGDACGAGAPCGNDLCYRLTFCSEVCRSAADCGGAGWACVMTSHNETGTTQYIPQCMYVCGDDADCTGHGTLGACQPGAAAPAPYQGTGFCTNLYTGTDRMPTGGDCDHTAVPPVFCEHAICNQSGTGLCTEVCVDNGDCQISGWTCVGSSVTFGGGIGTVPMSICDPP